MDVVKLLQNKTRCLQRFIEESEFFLGEARAGNLTRLEAFLEARESVLRAIDLFDRKTDEAIALLGSSARTDALKEAVRNEVRAHQILVGRSTQIDELITALIQAEALRLRKDAASQQRAQATLGRFRSQQPSGATGAELDEVF